MLSPLSPDKEIEALCNRCCPEMEQEIKFCTTDDGVRIAYATVGQGPPLVKAANWLNHLEFDWRSPIWRHLSEEFARSHFLVRYDERGNGLSDWDVENISFEAFVRDLEAVVNAVGLERFVLLGISQGGPVAIAYAIRHPEKVSHLVLYGSYARGWAKRGSPADEIERRQAYLTLTKLGWGQDHPAYRQLWTSLFVPDGTLEQWHWFNDLQRVSASPENAFRLLNEVGTIDVVDLLPQLKVPTLVLHCRDDAVAPFEEGRLLASLIPGARFVPLEGRNHLILENEPAWPAFVSEVRRFLGTDASKQERASDRAKGSSPTKFSQNSVLGRYRILSQLGAGGMGEVYLAEDTQLGRRVAMKLLPPETLSDEHARKRLVREARAVATLDHPNICSVYEVGEADGRSFIAMQYIEGETLDLKLKGKVLELKESLTIASQIADALTEAHTHGIIHRDIKPSNIIITARGQAKVMDFGLAKVIQQAQAIESEAATEALLSTPGAILGTVPYMSPEQVRGEALDARSDIFSFGVVLYEMLSGRQPFTNESAAATVSAILTHEPPPLARCAPNVPDELQRIVRKCLEKDRERRCQTMRDVALDLENVLRENESMQDVQRSSREQQATGAAAGTADRSRKWRDAFTSWRALLVVALGVTLVVAALVYTRRFRGVPATAAPEIKSLAVLPLDNLSGDPAQDYFADGMTEALITGLAKVSALRVISRTSVMQYKGTRKTVPEIARELNVDAIIEGSVQRAGERVQITAQLIQAATDRHLWAQTYERDLKDVLSLENEVAGTIAREIQIKLTPQEQAQLANVRSVNPEAYDNYLRGKFHAERVNKTDNETAIKLLERAVEIDPNFARAYTELAHAYNTKAFALAPQEKQWEEKAFVAVEKALALNPDLPEAHLARGLLLWTHNNRFPHESAIREYQRALALNPNLDEAHHQLGVVYGHIGLLDEAIQELQKALVINPTNALARFRVGAYLSYQGKYDQALPIYDSVPREVNPTLGGFQTAWVLFQLGRKTEASARVEELLRTYPRDEGGGLASMQALLFAAAGEERKAEEKIKSAIKTGQGFGHFHHTAYIIASAYALMNKHEPAIVWLQNAADDGFPCYPLFESDVNLNNLRQDPQFINFMAKQKEQWQHRKAAL